jgi:hypothetical protein
MILHDFHWLRPGFNGAEKNRLHGGELWMKKPAALPSKERFHVSKQQEWMGSVEQNTLW